MTDVVYVACASAYSNFGTKEGLRQAQKNIFTYPSNVESWANLITALLFRLISWKLCINLICFQLLNRHALFLFTEI